jgi:hypothetical protein
MPVEIRELVIRAVVTAEREKSRPAAEDESSPVSASHAQTEAIIQECVRQVLRILNKQKER